MSFLQRHLPFYLFQRKIPICTFHHLFGHIAPALNSPNSRLFVCLFFFFWLLAMKTTTAPSTVDCKTYSFFHRWFLEEETSYARKLLPRMPREACKCGGFGCRVLEESPVSSPEALWCSHVETLHL